MDDNKYIAARIKELRKKAGLDVEAVGAGCGRSGKTVSAWETGRNVPSAEMLITICRFFGVSISYFYPPEVTDVDTPEILPPLLQSLIDVCRRLNDQQIDILLATARNFAVANEKNGEGNQEDVEGVEHPLTSTVF